MIDDNLRFYREEITGYYNELLTLVANASGDASIAPDIVQEAMRAAWENIDRLRTYTDLRAAMSAITRNELANYYRRIKRQGKTLPFDTIETEQVCCVASCLECMLRTEEREEMLAAVAKLRKEYAEIILLHYYGDLSFREVAEYIGTKYNTVISAHRRALKKLAGILDNHKKKITD